MQIQGLDQLRRKLNRLEDFQNALYAPMEESAALVQDWISKAPRKSPGAFGRLATDKQRRWYFANARKGKIDGADPKTGKYTRTGSAKAWTYEIRRTGNGVQGVVGNVKDHMRFVQGEWQQPFHKESGWRTTDQAVEKNAGKIQGIFDRAVKRELNR